MNASGEKRTAMGDALISGRRENLVRMAHSFTARLKSTRNQFKLTTKERHMEIFHNGMSIGLIDLENSYEASMKLVECQKVMDEGS